MIQEIEAKRLLSHVKQPDPYFGLKYNMNIYRGCQHQCIYCDSRSECYQIENFNDVLVKINAIELLKKELPSKRVKGTIGTGSMNDPYAPVEKKYQLIRKALEIIAQYCYPVHIITKSNLVLRDLDLLLKINQIYAAVSFTITTTDDELAKKLEPGAPSPSERFEAMKILASHGIYTGITMMPILPFIEDNEENIINIIKKANASGAKYILPWFGLTLRDRQRTYFYKKLDELYPGVKRQYQIKYGNRYECVANQVEMLKERFLELCDKYGISKRMDLYVEKKLEQISLF